MATRPDLLPLAAECAALLIEAGRPDRWLRLAAILPPRVRSAGRMVTLEGRAALAAGRLDLLEAILAHPPTVDDLREAEGSLTDLWFGYHVLRLSRAEGRTVDAEMEARVRREFPPPYAIGFRMGP